VSPGAAVPKRLADRSIDEIAHELRTPLALIVGYAELLGARDDEETRREGPRRIVEAAERLSAGIDDLLGAHDRAGGKSDGDPGARPAAGRRRSVLIVDDDRSIRGLLRATLPPDEFETIEATNGVEALARIAERPPEILLLDWRMPGASGADVLAELRRRGANVRVVVLTAESDPDARADAESLAGTLGAHAFLTKPFSPIQLLRTIERLLGPSADQAAAG